jgi:membrane associated rhomboid family serine protease
MEDIGYFGFILLVLNGIVSYLGFKNHQFFDQYTFVVDKIGIEKDYKRLITSGFLHVSVLHLVLNMLTLVVFSDPLEEVFGPLRFLSIYFGSLLGGNLAAWYMHRKHGDYSAVGASGAISGVVFAAIVLFPNMGIGLLGIPLYLPSWLFGLFYVLFTIFGIKSQSDNIGHEAHLGGGLTGLILAIAFEPTIIYINYLPILFILTPTLFFIYLILRKPDILMIDNKKARAEKFLSIEDKYNHTKKRKQDELDRLLEKINKKGIDSLSKKEKKRLDELSQ